jgi:hypothetical protein
MIIRFMHSWVFRILSVAFGALMVIESVYTHFLVAVPMVLLGTVIAVSGIADICILEVLHRSMVANTDETMKARERHA